MTRLLIAISLALCSAFPVQASFRNDVMSVLSRGGCNSGACHGNLNGKGGFRLSLRGEDAEIDFATLTRDMLGRRIDVQRPNESLLLRKAAGLVPHEGGVRFSSTSLEYQIVRQWIEAGAKRDKGNVPSATQLIVSPTEQIMFDPVDRLRLTVQGTFSDGTTRDLSKHVVYEVTEPGIVRLTGDGEIIREQTGEVVVLVRYLQHQVPVKIAFLPNRPTTWKPIPEVNDIDRLVFTRLKALRLPPSELASDAMFVRRVYLDAIGLLPTIDETQTFLADRNIDKRERLIDALLQRPEFADFWALKWSDVLRNEEKSLDRKGVQVFHQWIRASIASGKPLNQFAQELVAGRGSTYEQPAANLYRSLRDPLSRAESVAQVFLGVRIGCAKCHNHPFDRWTMDDYHRFAACFSQIQYRVGDNNRRDKLDSHEFDGDQVVYVDRTTEWIHPRTKEAAKPKLLGVDGADLSPNADRLQVLADWIGDPGNTMFATAQANRIWFHLMGRGLVEPNDDFRLNNPATNPELLAFLAKDLADHRFDLRYLVRQIMTSRTYQLSSVPNTLNGDDDSHHSRRNVKTLQAEVLLDAFSQVLDSPLTFDSYPPGLRSGQIPAPPQSKRKGDMHQRNFQFLKTFGQPDRLLTCECERSRDPGLLQALQLITGDVVLDMIRQPNNRLGKLIKAGKTDREIVEVFFVAALCRSPTEKEWTTVTKFLSESKDRRQTLEDIVWAVVNSKEFLLCR